jgi:asparagine synthetase B (glutamine-hydrolysing)
METLPHLFPQILSRLEYRYPFLDKDLVSFLFSIPREQIVRPGRRRSLMRRALVGIVPDGILERRRKAFQLRAPLAALQHARPHWNVYWQIQSWRKQASSISKPFDLRLDTWLKGKCNGIRLCSKRSLSSCG